MLYTVSSYVTPDKFPFTSRILYVFVVSSASSSKSSNEYVILLNANVPSALFLTVSITSPSASNNSNSNISLASVFPSNVFFPLNVISPLAVYSFVNLKLVSDGLLTAEIVPLPKSFNVTVMLYTVSSYVTPDKDPFTSLIL